MSRESEGFRRQKRQKDLGTLKCCEFAGENVLL